MRFGRWNRREVMFSLVGRCVGIGDGRGDVLPTTFEHPLEDHLLRLLPCGSSSPVISAPRAFMKAASLPFVPAAF